MVLYITTAIEFLIYISLLYACYTDLLYRKILNKCVIFVLLLSLCNGMAIQDLNILAPVVFLVAGYIFTAIGCIGAGDIKLIAALLVGMPYVSIFPFFIMTCVVGVPVALLFLAVSIFVLKRNVKTVPFGIAIAVGYITVTT